MIIEDLIRLGRPLLDSNLSAEEILGLISDVQDDRVKNFYRNVFIVLLPNEAGAKPIALPRRALGSEDHDQNFVVDRATAIGIPFVLSLGGNPLNPQGQYGVPVYPFYDPQFTALRASPAEVTKFLHGRLARTPGLALDESVLAMIAVEIHRVISTTPMPDPRRNLGVLVLAQCGDGEFFRLGPPTSPHLHTASDGRVVIPNHQRILEGVWEAKIAEGREMGTRAGPCSISGRGEEVISAYCKPWPWALPTWNCPTPDGDVSRMVESIGLSTETYKALTLGACVFKRLTKRLTSLVLPELFSTSNSKPAQDARRRDGTKLTAIFGSAYLLPLEDRTLENPDRRHDFVRGMKELLAAEPKDTQQSDRYFTTVTGFDTLLPAHFDTDEYRLTLVYFSGDVTRGDIHLRAMIQDVVPGVLGRIREVAQTEAELGVELVRELVGELTPKQTSYLERCYESVPYLLARGYGGAFLWSQFEAVLRHRPLQHDRVTANTARRLESLIPTWPECWFSLVDEIGFYLHFLNFADRVNRELGGPSGGVAMPLRNWKELLNTLDTEPVENLMDLSDPAEIGFMSGAVVRWFSRFYYKGMSPSKPTADFLRDRVLTFGSSLRVEAVLHKALRFINELPNSQLRKFVRLTRDLAERAAAVSEAFRAHADQIDTNKDAFLTAFWAGYALHGYTRPRRPRAESEQSATANQE